MRLASYNVEWFDALFDDSGALLEDGWSARYGVTRIRQAEALGIVFTAMDADAIMVIEAPDTNTRRDTARALSSFVEAFNLRTTGVLTGFINSTQQEIALLYDPAVLSVRHAPMDSPDAPRFDGVLRIDLDIDAKAEDVTFSKPPLEVEVVTASGQRFRLIGAHLKSKAPHGAKGHDQVMRLSISNRRKQLAQAIWLRRRVDALLAAGEEVVVMGDLNDGPGLDEYEHLFGRSSVEIVLGQGAGALRDPNAVEALRPGLAPQPTSARFYMEDTGRYMQFMLDYVMVSSGLAEGAQWRIWHPFDDAVCWRDADLCAALLDASDHFPVTVDLVTVDPTA
ncbi:endonuclease/exonuclease/phosphatase family protein [Citreicella sp. C3M06]|uniref:endonuclease/exonuclease/phosphatase family protein n=1 Tax=Citreicella sp. C3M06 TaxID=2841564 RepID=UPI001C08D448|nr:endonuclease/exonuclease/phosphatase family protein [Citreicella sp. C3M06]MBU2962716.1 endonuclease/exonuclease/phosphatase family protein [Citreicella sp. C3M06]